MRKIITKCHLWLSLPFGSIISIICLTGAILIFENEILEARYPERYFTENSGGSPLSATKIVETAQMQVPDSVTITGIKIESDPCRNYLLYVSKGNRFFVDPYTGKIAGQDERSSFFAKVIRLHRFLMHDYKRGETPWGKWVVGTSTIVFIFILLTGLFLWFPKNKRMLVNRLTVKRGKGAFRFWYDFHISVGFYATLFLLLMAVTGLTWSFPWYRTPFYTLFGADPAEMAQGRKYTPQQIPDTINYQQWDKIEGTIRERYPDFNDITLRLDEATVTYADYGNIYEKDQFRFNLENGEITQTTRYADRTRYSQLRNWVYCLHTGGWGGITSRILYFLSTIAGVICVFTGYYFWWRKSHRKHNK